MFRRFLIWISHLWGLLCDLITPCTTPSHTPSFCSSESVASTTDSVPASTPTEYDVFLSFRGEDTRNNFTSHLYQKLDDHGIKTFKDEPELRGGEVISDALLDGIRKSKAYIVVLSENYASSSWCLDELAEILSCHKRMQRSVIPVFYNIEPAAVRHQTGSFKQAFKKHQVHFVGEREKVNKWKLGLSEVASFTGHHISKYRSEADVINKIVRDLLLNINPRTLEVVYSVGLDSHVEAISTLLSSDTTGVIKFGIYGMGGVGKTTLAKALFNQLVTGGRFMGSCFLANVRENSGTSKALVSLQEQLINDVLSGTSKIEVLNVDQGIRLIEDRICSTKVVVVIDDLDVLKHFRSLVGPFACGSVVIITTRDEEILDKIEVETRYRYMVNMLDYADALVLFKRHAFGNAEPNDTYMELSKEILCLAGGLPLALEVFGSHLSRRSEVGWKYYIEKLQRSPDSSIQQRLVISLDALESDDPILKKLFLDIACLFIGCEKQYVARIIKSYYSHPDYYIDMLKKRCLLTIDSYDRLGMHDLLQDMGRKISQNNCHEEPGKHSRLWVTKDIRDVLKNHKGTEAIECIIFDGEEFDSKEEFDSEEEFELDEALNAYSTETFKRMRRLRFLSLRNVNLTGSFKCILDDLRWLRWENCPLECLPSEFFPHNLVVLELPSSNMRTMWELNMVSHVFEKLKTLGMWNSKDLTTTPDFTKLPCLETLDLGGCVSLEEVGISIGSLMRLVSLNLKGCEKLRSLPNTICNLRALEVLDISKCDSLEELPMQLGNIISLTKLNAKGLTVSKLPDSIGHLSKLVKLTLKDNKMLETLPDTICNLRSLESLNIASCRSLESLPTEFGNIESLTKLNAHSLTVSKLPDSIGNLTKLVELDLSNNKKLETLPDTICNLRSLEELNLSRSGITALPSGLSQLSNLQSLEISGCRNLFSIPKLPPNLKRINAHKCKSLERLPNLSNLKLLEYLEISYCCGLTEIQGLEELTALEGPFFHSSGCNGLTYIERFRELPSVRTLRLPYKRITKQLFQLYIEYGHPIKDFAKDFDEGSKGLYSKFEEASDWMMESPYWTSGSDSTTLNACLLPNESHNFMGIIVCFEDRRDDKLISYSVKNTTTGFIWSGSLLISFSAWSFSRKQAESLMVIVPKSIFPITDDDREIEFTADVNIAGIHLLYKTETKMIDDVVKKHVFDIDALKSDDPVLQDIFLDISCFFIDWEKQDAVRILRILETYYPDVNHYIDILKNRCLLNINDEDKLEMDDLLQHIGRKTAQNNSPDEPEKHSRLWLSIDIYDVLNGQKGSEAIECISSRQHDYKDALEEKSFTTETFKRMSKLRFLYLRNVNLTGSYVRTLENLRWLCWDKCPLECLPSDFYPPKLVILELPHSQLRTMWEPNMVSHVFDKLKTLNMSYSLDLTRTPDFITLPCLEKLNFESCKSLKEVHISIGGLVRLSSLNLHDCVNLETLPDTISNLRMLKYLDIGGCTSLEVLPIGLGNCESLTELIACGLSVSKLPDSIGRLSKLVELKLNCNMNLETLPDSICNLRSLEILDISRCEKLEILEELPPNVKCITAHTCISLKRLPNLSNLKQLEELCISFCRGLTEIPGLEELTSIRRICLEACKSSLAYTFTKRLLEIYSGLRHHIDIAAPEFPDWIGEFPESCLSKYSGWTEIQGLDELVYSKMSLKFPLNVSQKFLGMILCFERLENHAKKTIGYYVENSTTGFLWKGFIYGSQYTSLMVIVPRSVFPIKYGEHIKLISPYAEKCKIYLLYKSKYDSATVDLEEERSKPSLSDLENNKNWLSLGTSINVEEEGSHPSKRLKQSARDNWLSFSRDG